ncbi:MAG: TolC family protein [Armatimonadetes bacterium]|nr:TolC family protein [Armatimonadota bacterium]
MRHPVFAILLIVLIMIAVMIGAQAETVPEKLSVADAVKLALTANVNLKSAKSNQLTALSRLRVAELLTSYYVGANTSFERMPGESELSNSIFGSLGYENMMGTEASLNISPFASGNESSSVDLSIRHPLTRRKGLLSPKADKVLTAQSEMIIQDKELYRTQQSTVLDVIRAYFKAIEAREQVKVQEKALELVEQSARFAKRREEAGFARGIDVYRAEVQVQQTRERLNSQREAAKAAIDRLMLAIGVGIGKTPELIDPVPEVNPEVPTLEEAIAQALKNRVELSVYDERLATQQRRLAIAKEEFRPGLDIFTRFRSSNADRGVFSSSLFDLGTTTIGLELRLPLDKRAIKEEQAIVERELNILNEERAFQMERIAEEVRSAYRALESTATSLEILTTNLEVAKQNLHIAERMVEEGEGDNRDVLSAQEALTHAEMGIISAKIDLYLATLELKYAMGEDLTTIGSK